MRLSPTTRLIAGTTLIRFVFAATTGLGIDESYMVTAGRVPSLGYFDHPPAGWWLSWGASHLFGTDAPWAVRLPFILLFVVSQILVWRIAVLVAGPPAGFWGVAAMNLSPVFGVTTASWVLPDGPLDTALLGAALCLLHALPAKGRDAWGWWAASGLCAGLALFSKYSAVLTIAGALVYLLTSRLHRPWLRRPEPYVAAALALTVFAPVLMWNATHGWASLAFQSDRAAGAHVRPLMLLQTLAGEALFLLPWIWVPMVILLIAGLRPQAPWPRRLLVVLAAPPILVFALISTWSSQRVLYHWAAPGYLLLFPSLGAAIARRIHHAWVRRMIAGSAALILLALAVICTQLQTDWLAGPLSAVTRKDPTPEGVDWDSIRDDLRERGLLPPNAVVAAINWRDAGKIGYPLGSHVTMLCLSNDARQFGIATPLKQFRDRDVLLLVVGPAETAVQATERWFASTELVRATSVRLAGRTLLPVQVIQGHRLLVPR